MTTSKSVDFQFMIVTIKLSCGENTSLWRGVIFSIVQAPQTHLLKPQNALWYNSKGSKITSNRSWLSRTGVLTNNLTGKIILMSRLPKFGLNGQSAHQNICYSQDTIKHWTKRRGKNSLGGVKTFIWLPFFCNNSKNVREQKLESCCCQTRLVWNLAVDV